MNVIPPSPSLIPPLTAEHDGVEHGGGGGQTEQVHHGRAALQQAEWEGEVRR